VITETDPDHVMPSTRERLTSEEVDRLLTWTLQGAQNNACQRDRDTTNVTYSGPIVPLITAKCKGCHSGTSPEGGLDFSTWSTLNMVALDGRLNGSVGHQNGYEAMPPGGMLPQCETDMIAIWVRAGAPNH
jgi:hypothetical protein